MQPLLDVRNLSVSYRPGFGSEVSALSGASFRIDTGEVLGVLGESGSGKTTLAASLIRLFAPNARLSGGAVLFEGRDLLELGSDDLRALRGNRVSLIFQEPGVALHPTMRVGEQVEEVLRAHKPGKGRDRHVLARTAIASVFRSDVDRIFSSYPHELSGGQRQRVAIAQAIACGPSLLIADEPTAALDPVTQREILDLLKRLQKDNGLAIMFITHNPELLVGFADRVLALYAGAVIEQGNVEDVLFAGAHPYTKALLRCRPSLKEITMPPPKTKLPVISGEPPGLVPSAGCAFAPRCPEMMDVCERRRPVLVETSGTHQVGCFKFGAE